MSRFSASITIQAGVRNMAISEAISADCAYYDGPDRTTVSMHDGVQIVVEADRISHLRAGVNSVLRLAHAADQTIKSNR